MTVMGFVGANTISQLISATLFFPLGVYFLFLVIPKKKRALIIPGALEQFHSYKSELKKEKSPVPAEAIDEEPIKLKRQNLDIDRRMFLKLIGSAGVGLFFMTIFTKRAEAAFFGSVPGPGTVAIKNSSGVQIDPAEKQPTDGYKIAQLDDSSPAYYGFLDKSGNWYIMEEDSSGDYRYAKGASSFSTNWTNRAALSYDYFDAVF